MSATVICDDAITADAWDSAFVVLGLERSKELLKNLPDIEVYFIYRNAEDKYEVFYSGGMKKMIVEQEK